MSAGGSFKILCLHILLRGISIFQFMVNLLMFYKFELCSYVTIAGPFSFLRDSNLEVQDNIIQSLP